MRTLLLVQISGAVGSPLVCASTRFCNASLIPGCFNSAGFLPPPRLRHRTISLLLAVSSSNSFSPRLIVTLDMPDIMETLVTPPYPMAFARPQGITVVGVHLILEALSLFATLTYLHHLSCSYYILFLFICKCYLFTIPNRWIKKVFDNSLW